MAGDWIAVTKELPRKREVLALCRLTGRSRLEVLGILVEFWLWVDGETTDGTIAGVTIGQLPFVVEGTDEQFWLAVQNVGWLTVANSGLEIPNFDRWIGDTAKERMQNTKRKKRSRDKGATETGQERDKTVTKSATKARPSNHSESNLRDESLIPSSSEPPKAASEVPAGSAEDRGSGFQFPVVGNGSKEWELPARSAVEYAESFPGVDIEAELRKARQWCRDNPTRRKTAKGMPRFLNGWLERAQNAWRSNGSQAGNRSAAPPTSDRTAGRFNESDSAVNGNGV